MNRNNLLEFYKYVMESLRNELMEPIILRATVIINGDRSQGTGFVAYFDNKAYVVSNAHVFIGNNEVNLRTVEGRELKYNRIFMSKDRDLMLYALNDLAGLSPLEVINGLEDLRIGTSLVVYGNSQGAGVATYLTGTVIAVGPAEVETDAGFVAGNSGSPLIVNGRVGGVATYAVRFNRHWVNEGTRFTSVRRFATRIDNLSLADFVEIDQDLYREQNSVLNQLTTINSDLIGLLQNHRFDRLSEEMTERLSEKLTKAESFEDLGSYMIREQFTQQIQIGRGLLIILDEIDQYRRNILDLERSAMARQHEIPDVIDAVLREQRRGLFGVQHWVDGATPSRLFVPISWEILNYRVNGIRVRVPVVVNSSRRDGMTINKEWSFDMLYTQLGWKLENIRF